MSYYPPPYPGPPPPPQRRPIRGGRVLAGVGIALAAHLLTLVLSLAGFVVRDENIVLIGFSALLIGQFVVAVVCLVVGIVLTVRGDGGIGVGLLIGWAVGLLVAPVVGFGLCIAALDGFYG